MKKIQFHISNRIRILSENNFSIVSNVENDAVRYGIFHIVFIPINYMMPRGTNYGDIGSEGKKTDSKYNEDFFLAFHILFNNIVEGVRRASSTTNRISASSLDNIW